MSVELKMSGDEATAMCELVQIGKLAVRLIELRKDAATDKIIPDNSKLDAPPCGGISIARAESAMQALERAVSRLPVGVVREVMRGK